MKKIITLLAVCFLAVANVKAQYVTIPDTAFRNYLISQYPSCFNGAKQMDTTCNGVVNAKVLSIEFKIIYNLSGIRYFKSLQTLNCRGNYFSSIDSLPATLKDLYCGFLPNLTSINGLPNGLRGLFMASNPLITSLPSLPSTIDSLDFSDCSVSVCPALPNSMRYLSCYRAKLTSFIVLPDSLKQLFCYQNTLTSLPAIPSTLTSLSCDKNLLTSLPLLPNSLMYLSCTDNKLTSIPNFPNSLLGIYCLNNLITNISGINSSLQYLHCYNNKITSISQLPSTLIELKCSNNLLTALPDIPYSLNILACNNNPGLHCISYLPKPSIQLYFDTANIKCLPDSSIYLLGTIGVNTYPICNATNNPNNCPVYPTNYVNIPDTSFGKLLLSQYPSCLYKDANNLYWMDTTCSGVVNAKTIRTSGQFQYFPFANLQGIEYFKNLDSLDCFATLISNLSTLPKNLKYLNCGANQLTSLPTLPNSLLYLQCEYNNLSILSSLPNSLLYLNCGYNNLGILPTLPNSLLYLNCANTGISTLPTLPPAIERINCSENINLQCLPYLPNSIYELGIGNSGVTCLPNYPVNSTGFVCNIIQVCNPNNPNNCSVYNYVNIPDTSFAQFLFGQNPLCIYRDNNNLYWMDTTNSWVVNEISLNCDNYSGINKIESIEGLQYFKSLQYFSCGNNKLSTLPTLPNSLRDLNFYNNQLTSLPNLPNSLQRLECAINKLTNLPSIPSSVTILGCGNNLLTSLPSLPNNLQRLYCNDNKLTSLPNSTYPALTTLFCSNNLLTSLPLLSVAMDSLFCDGNVNLSCLPKLPATIYTLNLTNTNIKCLPNMPSVNFMFPASLSVCNSTNNPNNCTIYPANYVNIPDTSFGKFLLAQYPSCLYKDASNLYWMDTTCSGVVNELGMNCDNLGIKDLTGIQYFKKLIFLYCYSNQLTSLPKLSDSIEQLLCDGNQLTSLPVLPTKLLFLNCYENHISILPQLPDSLYYLGCGNNQISVLPQLPNSMRGLNCEGNQISTLPVLPDSLTYFSCKKNLIINLTAIPKKMENLECSYNPLSNMPELPQSLKQLSCRYTNIHCLPKLPNQLNRITIDQFKVECIPNFITGLIIYDSSDLNILQLPICNPTNNINQCQAFPTIAGRVFTDNNSNGIKDANEFYRPFVKELASNGDATFSNLDGAFAFSFDSTGSYSLKTIAPKYFKAVPDSNSFSFANNNVYISVPDIALQPTAVKDSLAIVVTPLNSRARPGFSFPYNLGYANVGTTNLYTTVSFTYDTSRLIYDSSSVAIVSNTNNIITVSANTLVAGEGRYAKLYFTVKPTAVIGDTLFAVANAVSVAATANSANATIIRGSFDPNDKVATPQLTLAQVANGDWIEYTIHFQNTGNDTAINVVLADTLSSLLQPGYFNVISTSHPSNITYHINNNIVYFEFLHINLPDSATNYSGSQGWITFKVKPLSSIADGTYIDNKASIYFDYNKSVQTNLARTLISNTPMPIKLLSYALRLTLGDKKVVENIWSTTNEINASHFNIQRSIDGANFKNVGQVAAKGGSSYNFTDPLTINNLPSTIFYRLQMVDKDGRFEYSPIREIKLHPSASNIRLYPNPAKDMVTIECANAKEILITDYLGKRILNKKIINNQSSIINLQGFTRGIYLVQVVLDNGSIVNEKLIVE